MNEFILYPAVFLSGTFIGSFLNLLIDRIPRGEDIVFKRSHCDKCKHVLTIPDLFPVLSYLFLSGKCRYCRKKIPLQNPIVEIVSGFLFMFFVAFFINKQFGIMNFNSLLYHLIITSTLLVIFVIDLKKSIIPDPLVIFLLIITLIYKLIYARTGIFEDLLAGLTFASFFFFLAVITRGRGMGMGDVKFAFFMGTYLGFSKIIPAFYAAFLTGSIISLILVFMRQKTIKSKIPFGPFLVFATIVADIYGNKLIFIFQKFFGL